MYEGKYGITFVKGDIKCTSYTDGTYSYTEISGNQKHTWNDWGLIPKARPVVSPPEVKTDIVDINTINGDGLDLSESLTGYPIYKNRKLEVEFYRQNGNNWTGSHDISDILNWGHGQVLKVILDDDPTWYYEGRLSISETTSDKYWSVVKISCSLHPFASYVYTSEEWSDTDELLWDLIDFSADGDYPKCKRENIVFSNDPDDTANHSNYKYLLPEVIEAAMPLPLKVKVTNLTAVATKYIIDGSAASSEGRLYKPLLQPLIVCYSTKDDDFGKGAALRDRTSSYRYLCENVTEDTSYGAVTDSLTFDDPQLQSDPTIQGRCFVIWSVTQFNNYVKKLSSAEKAGLYYTKITFDAQVIYRKRKL